MIGIFVVSTLVGMFFSYTGADPFLGGLFVGIAIISGAEVVRAVVAEITRVWNS